MADALNSRHLATWFSPYDGYKAFGAIHDAFSHFLSTAFDSSPAFSIKEDYAPRVFSGGVGLYHAINKTSMKIDPIDLGKPRH